MAAIDWFRVAMQAAGFVAVTLTLLVGVVFWAAWTIGRAEQRAFDRWLNEEADAGLVLLAAERRKPVPPKERRRAA